MKSYDRLTLLRNVYRAKELRIFRDLVSDYFSRVELDADGFPLDWDGAQAARSKINQKLPRILQLVRAAGLGSDLTSTVPNDLRATAMVRVDVLLRIFNARYAEGVDQEIFDVLDMALGIYDGDRLTALGRTLNPFHHLGTFVTFVASWPRRALTALGLGRGSGPRSDAAELTRLEAVASRLGNADDLIESRLAAFQHRQGARIAELSRQVAELEERLDFAERVVAQQKSAPLLRDSSAERLVTPV